MTEIRNRFTDKKIAEGKGSLKTITEKAKADLAGADLYRADLYRADLSGASLYRADLYRADLAGANLSGASLSGANLSGASLYRADLSGADLTRADLTGADLSGADLSGADLTRADLTGADLSGADLTRADLTGADLEFHQFPSIRLVSSIQLGELSDEITLELMRRDVYAHPKPELFNEWVKGGNCPYQNEERCWFFSEKRALWKTGDPTIRDSDLIIAICKEKGWKIKGYLQ